MELTKKILNISAAFSIVALSLSAFIYSIRDNKANASPPQAAIEGYTPVGAVVIGNEVWLVGSKGGITPDAKLLMKAHK